MPKMSDNNILKVLDALKEQDLKLVLEGNYEDFTDFFNTNKEKILRGIVELFKKLIETKKEKQTLTVFAQINGIPWQTEFIAGCTSAEQQGVKGYFDKQILLKDILPFFEQIEDYEFCSEIMKTYKAIK